MGVGVSSATSNQSGAEEHIEAAAEMTGLEPEFDSIVCDPSLDPDVPAATRFQKNGLYERTDFVENPYSFQQLSEDEKLNASVHEILESKQVNGFIGEELKQTHDISDEFADFLNYAQTEFPNQIREGMVQAIANEILPEAKESGQRFYPKQTDIFQTILEGKGFDLEEELFDEAKNEVKETYNSEVYDFAIDDNIYFETGSVAGRDYSFMALGDKADVYGPEIADRYKEEIVDYVEPGSGLYEPDLNY